MYEKWDHGVTTKNELGRKVYKRFYTRTKALNYMYSLMESLTRKTLILLENVDTELIHLRIKKDNSILLLSNYLH